MEMGNISWELEWDLKSEQVLSIWKKGRVGRYVLNNQMLRLLLIGEMSYIKSNNQGFIYLL